VQRGATTAGKIAGDIAQRATSQLGSASVTRGADGRLKIASIDPARLL
jgi:hypothetical protein